MPEQDNDEAAAVGSDEGGVGGKEGHCRVFPVDELTVLMGDKSGGQLSKTLIHLVIADFAYVDYSETGIYVCHLDSTLLIVLDSCRVIRSEC